MYCEQCGEKIIGNHHICKQQELEMPPIPQEERTMTSNQKNIIIGLAISAVLMTVILGVATMMFLQTHMLKTFAKQVDGFTATVEKNDLGTEEAYYTKLLEECNVALKNKDRKAIRRIARDLDDEMLGIERLVKENEDKVTRLKKQLENQDTSTLYAGELNILEEFKKKVQGFIDQKEYTQAMKTLGEWEGSSNKLKNPSNYDLKINQVDVSNYPTVKLYLEIEDYINDKLLDNLTLEHFYLSEKSDGSGPYIKKQITKAVQLDQVENLNINLVADVSGSMLGYPLMQAQTVMKNFVDKVQFQAGDKISLISFAESVRSEVPFSSDRNLIMNTINRLTTGDMTALYDALYVAVNQTAMESGAKCIIAFTDGMDNDSQCTPEIVTELATRYSIPIFIIGVGQAINSGPLDYITTSTGGFYRNINDINSMEEIYKTIYEQQKDVYLVEYKTDQSKDKLNIRDIYINYMDNEIVARSEYQFTPANLMETTTSFSQLFVHDFIIYDSDTRYLTVADLRMLTQEQLRLARNEIYARRGRMFLDQGLQSHFSNLSWYNPSIYPDDFSETIFNDYERANAYFIKDYENLHGFN